MLKDIIIGLAIPAFAFSGLAAIGYATAPAKDAPQWMLVQDYRGDSFVIDHGLSLSDCVEATPRNQAAKGLSFACERER